MKIGAGNKKKGQSKIEAQLRSSLRRSARQALVIDAEWANLILSGRKTWELRQAATSFRGFVHLVTDRDKGMIIGRVRLVDCREVSREDLLNNVDKHMVTNSAKIKRPYMWAWVLTDPMLFDKPFFHKHDLNTIQTTDSLVVIG